MNFIKFLAGIGLGAVVGTIGLTLIARVAPVEFTKELSTDPVPEPQSNSEYETPVQSLRQLALAMNFAGAEKNVAHIHGQSLVGEISFDELREIFSVFESTDPNIRQFAEDWVNEMPDSAYALTALGWNVQSAASYMRGEETGKYLYQDAASRSQHLFERASELGQRAQRSAPDFVPASDLGFNLMVSAPANSTSRIVGTKLILEETMRLTPNRGSLLRALGFTQPKFGGDFSQTSELCSIYAHSISEPPGYDTETCLVDVAYTYDFGPDIRGAAKVLLNTKDHPFLDYARRIEWQPGISQEQDQNVLEYLEGDGSTDYFLAQKYDYALNDDRGSLGISTKVRSNQYQASMAALESDPYNPTLIKDALISSPVSSGITSAEATKSAVDLAKRALTVAPFSPDAWATVARHIQSGGKNWDASSDDYFANAITFSNHKPEYYFQFLQAKLRQYRMVQSAIERDGLVISAADVDETYLCPLIRLERLREAICSAPPEQLVGNGPTCAELDSPVPPLAKRIKEAQSRNACADVINANFEDLFFLEPVETDVGLPPTVTQ